MRERKRACDLLGKSEESGNIANSISVLLLEAARPPEQQGDASMKMILVVVAFATFTVLPPFAQSPATEGPSYSRAYPEQKKHFKKHLTNPLGAAYRAPNGSAWNSNQPASNVDPNKAALCSTAPAFCPDYHGDNGA
jgi:hypothetical protein